MLSTSLIAPLVKKYFLLPVLFFEKYTLIVKNLFRMGVLQRGDWGWTDVRLRGDQWSSGKVNGQRQSSGQDERGEDFDLSRVKREDPGGKRISARCLRNDHVRLSRDERRRESWRLRSKHFLLLLFLRFRRLRREERRKFVMGPSSIFISSATEVAELVRSNDYVCTYYGNECSVPIVVFEVLVD